MMFESFKVDTLLLVTNLFLFKPVLSLRSCCSSLEYPKFKVVSERRIGVYRIGV